MNVCIWDQRFYKRKICQVVLTSTTVLQMEICLDDARQDPLKYKPYFPCDFDAIVAPRLSAMKGGRRLPFRETRTPSGDSVDRLM